MTTGHSWLVWPLPKGWTVVLEAKAAGIPDSPGLGPQVTMAELWKFSCPRSSIPTHDAHPCPSQGTGLVTPVWGSTSVSPETSLKVRLLPRIRIRTRKRLWLSPLLEGRSCSFIVTNGWMAIIIIPIQMRK